MSAAQGSSARDNSDEHTAKATTVVEDGVPHHDDDHNEGDHLEERRKRERHLVRKVDLRLCTIAGILCSLNLLDSGIISSASVTSIFSDLGLGVGNRYSVAILVYTVASVTFQLPATVAVRMLGPRLMFASITVAFGIITMVSGFRCVGE